jgi:hypothetical protein
MKNHTKWTFETFKEYFQILVHGNDRRYKEEFDNQKLAVKDALAAQKELTNAAFASSEKAIVKAEDAQRDYNVRSNEFRGQLDDQAKTLMPRTEVVVMINSLQDKQFLADKANEDKIAELAKKVDSISNRLTTIEGRGSGANSLWGYIIGLGGLIAILISVIKVFSSK